MNTELRLVHNISSSNKHGKSAKDYRFTDGEKLDMAEISIRLQCSEHEINILQEVNIAKQGTVVFYKMHTTKVPY